MELMEIVRVFLGEAVIGVAYLLCKVLGKDEVAKKIAMRKKKRKLRRKAEARCKKEAEKLEDDFEVLKEYE